MGLNRFKVRTRIFAGFIALILITLLMAGFGISRLFNVGEATSSMKYYSGRVGRVFDGTRRLEALSRAEASMRLDGDGIKDARDNLALVRDIITESARVTRLDTARAVYTSMTADLAAHTTDLDRYAELTTRALEKRTALFSAGDELTKATIQLIGAARATHDPAIAEAASDMYAAVLLVRVVSYRFMATEDKTGPALFNTNREKAGVAATALQRIASPAISQLVTVLQSALDAYASDFDAFSAARISAVELFKAQLHPQIAKMQDQFDSISKTLNSTMDAAGVATIATVTESVWLQSVMAAAALLLGGTFALLIGRGISRPIDGMTSAMTKLAAGDRTVIVPARDQRDEIGAMARAVEVFKQDAIAKHALEEQQVRDQSIEERRREEIDQLVGFFGRSVGGVFTTLAAAGDNMTRSSVNLERSASDTDDQTRVVLREVEETAQSVQTVAAASEQLSASISAIGQQAGESQRIATDAMQQSEDVVVRIAELRAAAQQIGAVVDLISDIAGQTNLLALNATIEAARAGDSGRGFAVVASEVKTLAAQTATATGQIGTQISAIQAATARVADAMQGIAGTVCHVNEIALAIASAVLQQGAATQEISRSVQQVSGNTANVANSMGRVQQAVSGNGHIASEVKHTATTLAAESGSLSEEVKDFLSALNDLSGGERLLSYHMNAPATVTIEGRKISGQVTRMSPGTALFVGPLIGAAGTALDLEVQGFDRALRARIVDVTSSGVNLQLPLGHEHMTNAARTLARLGLKAAA